jgi:hypothetical protein
MALVICACAPLHAQEQTASGWCYQYLLATWTPRTRLAPLLEGIAADPRTRTALMLDNVAQLLLDHLDDERLLKDDAKLLLSLLTRTQSGRYQRVMATVRDSQRPAVLKDMARKYMLEHKKKTVDQYLPGTIDFEPLRAEYMRMAVAVRPTEERARALNSLKTGDAIEELFALLGPPQHVATRHIRLGTNLDFRHLLLYYRGAGRAVFELDDTEGWRFHAVVADPLAYEPLMPYRARAGQFGLPDDAALNMALLTGNSVLAMKVAVEDSYHQPEVPLEFLDTAAEILAQNWKSAEAEDAVDTCAWIIRLLADKGGPRYAPLLAQVADGSNNLKLKRWAKQKVQKPAGVPRAHYVVGSVVLADQARKFPSPYPGVTYTNGRL